MGIIRIEDFQQAILHFRRLSSSFMSFSLFVDFQTNTSRARASCRVKRDIIISLMYASITELVYQLEQSSFAWP